MKLLVVLMLMMCLVGCSSTATMTKRVEAAEAQNESMKSQLKEEAERAETLNRDAHTKVLAEQRAYEKSTDDILLQFGKERSEVRACLNPTHNYFAKLIADHRWDIAGGMFDMCAKKYCQPNAPEVLIDSRGGTHKKSYCIVSFVD